MTDSVARVIAEWRGAETMDPVYLRRTIGIVMRVRRLSGHLDRELDAFFASFGITPLGYGLIAALRRVGSPFEMRLAELPRLLGARPAAVRREVDRLAERGFVVREGPPRRWRVVLTAQGSALFDTCSPVHMANEDAFLGAALSDEQRGQLEELLADLLAAFEATGGGAPGLTDRATGVSS